MGAIHPPAGLSFAIGLIQSVDHDGVVGDRPLRPLRPGAIPPPVVDGRITEVMHHVEATVVEAQIHAIGVTVGTATTNTGIESIGIDTVESTRVVVQPRHRAPALILAAQDGQMVLRLVDRPHKPWLLCRGLCRGGQNVVHACTELFGIRTRWIVRKPVSVAVIGLDEHIHEGPVAGGQIELPIEAVHRRGQWILSVPIEDGARQSFRWSAWRTGITDVRIIAASDPRIDVETEVLVQLRMTGQHSWEKLGIGA